METAEAAPYVLGLQEIDASQIALVGGKGAHLGALSRIEGIRVPAGFCVTTAAFERILASAPPIDERLDRLSQLALGDLEAIRTGAADLRHAIEGVAVPGDVAAAITEALGRLGPEIPCAVRSSATAEDLPAASFAGQHDTSLDVVGPVAILEHVRRCWASLFTERAVAYRLHHGLDPRKVRMAVVVQEMVFPEASGVLFTADPVTGNRRIVSVEATFGLGEALVSGRSNGDVYKVRDGEIVDRRVATNESEQGRPAITDAQVLRLASLGRRIEAHFGSPQDVEWCLAGDALHVVQSRPITTLFPIPEAGDDANRVYLSVGHQQMMTEAMRPLGLSLWKLTSRAPMREAGGRLFVDVTQALASPARRAGLLEVVGRGDPLFRDALETLLARGDLITELPEDRPVAPIPGGAAEPLEADPTIVDALIERSEASLAVLARDLGARSGVALVDFILEDIKALQALLFDPRSHRVIMAGMEAAWWLDAHLESWLGEKGAADALTRSVPHDVTAEMGLALLEVADVIRPHQSVVAILEHAEDDFLDALPGVPGGPAAREAIRGYLDRYGMRCVGEIDVTRPRWSERPTALLPMLLADVERFEAGEAARRFQRGRRDAERTAQDVLERLQALPDGARKAEEAKGMIDRLRTFAGYREYPKFAMIRRYFVYKRALLEEAERLVQAGILRDRDDVFFLTLPEIQEVVRTGGVDDGLIDARRDAFASHRTLTPPRVLTSEGECLAGAYHRDDLPAGALVGVAVSAGTVEGRARVVRDVAAAKLEDGDILVAAFTDPSFSPVLVAAGGLVTEVGGLMTHGAVIAREYGVPAVVGVKGATRLIRDGQRIRVDGTHGYVEILAEPCAFTTGIAGARMRAMHRYEIWHNPRCGKSRAALKKLEDAGVDVTVVRYLDDPPSKAKLEKTLKQIGFDDPRRLMRTKEQVYKDLKLSAETRKGALVDAMVANPILIERPVVIRDDGKAVLGRPTDEVDRLL